MRTSRTDNQPTTCGLCHIPSCSVVWPASTYPLPRWCVDQQRSGCATFLLGPSFGPHPHILYLVGVWTSNVRAVPHSFLFRRLARIHMFSSSLVWVDELDRFVHCQMRITEDADRVIGTPQIRHDSRSWSHICRKNQHLDAAPQPILGEAVDTT